LLKKFTKKARQVSVILDGIHGAILAYSVRVQSLNPKVLDTHYGPAGHHPKGGQPLTFRLLVDMQDDLSELVVKCGWVGGMEFPAKGPIPEVTVYWSLEGLDKHGMIACGDGCIQMLGRVINQTGADGVATVTFTPRDEPPGAEHGDWDQEMGMIVGSAMYQSKFDNMLGTVSQVLAPKSASTLWAVHFHEVPGFLITIEGSYEAVIAWIYSDHEDRFEGAGQGTWEIFVPMSALIEPFQYVVSFTGHGSGSFVNHSPRYWDYAEVYCSGTFSGAWEGTVVIDGLVPGEPVPRHIRISPSRPDNIREITTYTGAGCGQGGARRLDSAFTTGTRVALPIDLQATGVQRASYVNTPMCDILTVDVCEVSNSWTIRVRIAGESDNPGQVGAYADHHVSTGE
jgi:hypothetical protein